MWFVWSVWCMQLARLVLVSFCMLHCGLYSVYCRVSMSGDRVDYTTQIQLRFCIRDMTSRQSDRFPSHVMIKVNNETAQLPVGFTCFFLGLTQMNCVSLTPTVQCVASKKMTLGDFYTFSLQILA